MTTRPALTNLNTNYNDTGDLTGLLKKNTVANSSTTTNTNARRQTLASTSRKSIGRMSMAGGASIAAVAAPPRVSLGGAR
jgi:hypothetical protein